MTGATVILEAMSQAGGEPPWVAETRSHRRGVRTSAMDVEDALARPAAGRTDLWRLDLRDRIASLAGAFDRHIEVSESPGGVLESVVADQPRLLHRADRLRRDHEDIHEGLHRLVVDMDLDRPLDTDEIGQIRVRVSDLLGLISHHRYLGAEFIYQGYEVDIEAGD